MNLIFVFLHLGKGTLPFKYYCKMDRLRVAIGGPFKINH